MPTFLPPEAASFTLSSGSPVITLAVQPPPDLAAGEWSLLSRLTLLVVDGPGEAGYLLPRLGPAGDVTPPGWDEAVEEAAGSHVVFGTAPNAPAVFARALT
ncbi:hypothetical protein ACFFX1_30175 [Dactylosporangium sucinum]|uniref:hypothetical protein n=1 Tax=Dactylosporangium sucinum TaxID=1424081 RepID=UPI00167E754C|nr:hypothetical protein [Dactylosporangium sucinum]